MKKYKLTLEAKEDLHRIYRYGIEVWSEEQADEYYFAFFERFDEIAENPYMYQAVEHIRKDYRHSICGADTIYFRITEGVVEIMAIIGQQNI